MTIGIDNYFEVNPKHCKVQLKKIFPDWQVTDDLEIIQGQSNKHVRFITESQMGHCKWMGLYPSAISIDPKIIWIKFAVIGNGGTGGGGIL